MTTYTEDDTATCAHVYNLGSYANPPEPCDNDAEDGSEYCSLHNNDLLGDDGDYENDYWND